MSDRQRYDIPQEEDLVIRPLGNEEELLQLERQLAGEPQETHRDRYAQQLRQEVCYLVAWLGMRPVGHLLVRWEGTAFAEEATPELEDFFVVPELRGKRIGLRLIERAEALVGAEGHRHLGLSVGLTQEYDRARTLYARRGYRTIGFALHYRGWWTRDAQGEPVWWEEAVEYLGKALAVGECP